jgi:hypothetical protein
MIVQVFYSTQNKFIHTLFLFQRLAKKNNLNILIYIFVFLSYSPFLDIVVILILILIIIRVRKTYCLRGSSPSWLNFSHRGGAGGG